MLMGAPAAVQQPVSAVPEQLEPVLEPLLSEFPLVRGEYGGPLLPGRPGLRPRSLAGRPALVRGRSLPLQQQILHPVGAGPARGGARTHAKTPVRGLPGISCVAPHDRLQVQPHRRPVRVRTGLAVLGVEGDGRRPRRNRGTRHPFGQRLGVPGAGVLHQISGAAQYRHIRRRTGLELGDQGLAQGTGALVDVTVSGPLLDAPQRHQERLLLAVGPRAEDDQRPFLLRTGAAAGRHGGDGEQTAGQHNPQAPHASPYFRRVRPAGYGRP